MKKNIKSTKQSPIALEKKGLASAGVMRAFYVLMLLMTILSLILRVSNTKRAPAATSGSNTSARILNYHREDHAANSCEDLVITAAGRAIYSNCGKGVEKQYTLSETEFSMLKVWISQFRALNYSPDQSNPTDKSTVQLFLNGQGQQQANDIETRQVIDFASTLAAKVALGN